MFICTVLTIRGFFASHLAPYHMVITLPKVDIIFQRCKPSLVCHYLLEHFKCWFLIAEVLQARILQQLAMITLSCGPLMFVNHMMKQSNPLSLQQSIALLPYGLVYTPKYLQSVRITLGLLAAVPKVIDYLVRPQ